MAPSMATDAVIPLTTIFSGAPDCKANHLTMIGSLQDELWLNEPYPASGLTSAECYPTEVLASIANPTALPAFSPLICPDWYTTATHWSQNYIACCPSSYTLHLTTGPTPALRSAYNATCYSNLPTQATVTAYDSVSITSTQGYNNPTAQVYAHAIDGWAPMTASGGVLIVTDGPAPTLTPGSTSVLSQVPFTSTPNIANASPPSALSTSSSSTASATAQPMSTGTIVGITVAGSAFCVLSALVSVTVLLLRRRRRSTRNAKQRSTCCTNTSHPCSPVSSTHSSAASRKGPTTTSVTVSPTTPRSPGDFRRPNDTYANYVGKALPPPPRPPPPAELSSPARYEIADSQARPELGDGRNSPSYRMLKGRVSRQGYAELPGAPK